MRSLWDDREAAGCQGELALRVYTSRLLGRDRSLVLHGGGNTSVKVRQPDVFGEMEEVIHVKGSGWDLETIAEAGFAPLRLAPVRRLAELPALSDPRMVNELVTQSVRAGAPVPSVEAILHAILAPRYVDHTHADAVVTVTNTADGARRVREIYGDTVLIVPYVMPGFELARAVHQQLAAAGALARMPESLLGMVLLHHGVFSFADTARESYERMIHLVDLAERHLQSHRAWVLDPGAGGEPAAAAAAGADGRAAAPAGGAVVTAADGAVVKAADGVVVTAADGAVVAVGDGTAVTAAGGAAGVAVEERELAVAALRRELSDLAGRPLIVTSRRDARSRRFTARGDLAQVALQGPATPDHVLRTKQLPLVGRDVAAYAAAYRAYFAAHAAAASDAVTMLDAAPRIVLDADLGLLAAGRTPGEAAIAAEIYQHTMDVIERADRLGGYRALPAADLFAVEYWDLEQAKLRRAGEAPPFSGEAALVTGAASGIGKACVEALLARGAAVAALDVDPRIEEIFAAQPAVLGRRCDVTDEAAVAAAVGAAVAAFGGLDVLVLNAGVFPDGRDIAALGLAEWRAVTAVNLDANVSFLRLCHPLLRLAPRGGRVAVIGSKNVPAPGRGVAAYSASKAALQQLARVAALEWGGDGIRVNIVHPNAVFDTAIWTEERLAARAAAYHVDVDTYRRRGTVLGVEVRSRDVAEVAIELCGPRFSRTTGAQVPVDGGNERVI